MSENFVFHLPDAVRINYTKDMISVEFAHTRNHKLKNITESDITGKAKIDFEPKELLTTMALMALAADEYQKKFKVNMGISIGRNHSEEKSDELEK